MSMKHSIEVELLISPVLCRPMLISDDNTLFLPSADDAGASLSNFIDAVALSSLRKFELSDLPQIANPCFREYTGPNRHH